jgi:uncharacterized protein (UPF0276 family)
LTLRTPARRAPESAAPPSGPLGVGFPLIRGVDPDVYREADLVQFVELSPETVCRERAAAGGYVLELDPLALDDARRRAGDRPMVAHGVELSIGSAHRWNESYVVMLEELAATWPFAWHSEHLSFQTYLDELGVERDVGVPLPLSPTEDAASMVAERCRRLRRRVGRPFLLENAAHYLPGLHDAAASEGSFLRRVCDAGEAWLPLDLHNLHCNATNFGFDAREMLDAMPLERVVEVHVAGGEPLDGFWTDAHAGAVPQPVWDLLEHCAGRMPAWRGLVFEILDVAADRLPTSLIRKELERAHDAWRRRH